MRAFGSVALSGLVAALAVAAPSAMAKTYEPTRFDDPAPGKCKPDNCSLREALLAVEKDDGAKKVKLGSGTYRLTIPDGPGFGAESGDLDVFDPATIAGRGAKKTTIKGSMGDRIFDLNPTSGTDLPQHRISGMTIRGGDAAVLEEEGGAIRAFISKTTIDDVVAKGNFAQGGGGAVAAFRARIKISGSTLSGNSTEGSGGAIFIPNGAAIPNTLVVKDSAILGNTGSLGGGVAFDGNDRPPSFDQKPSGSIINSTVAENEAQVSGGGVSAIQGATVLLSHASVGFNTSDADNSGGGSGGGLYQSTGTTFTLNDSVLASNGTGTTGMNDDCSGVFSAQGNVLNDDEGCTGLATASNLQAATLIASAPASNGGPTQTMALSGGSPALGFALGCPKFDQRGVKRPDDCDSGAFERVAGDP